MEKKKIKKVLKIILIIIAILIILFLIHTIRNFIIVLQLQTKISQFTDVTNYHIKTITNEESGIIVTVNYYKKDNKQAYFLERNKDNEIIKMFVYSNGEKTHMYTETPEYKTANLNVGNFTGVEIVNSLYNRNTWQTILSSMMANIKTVKLNEKDCYEINNFPSEVLWLGLGKNVIYIEKDTGLMIRNDTDSLIVENMYEFNTVNDEIFIEPDISQYQVYEK